MNGEGNWIEMKVLFLVTSYFDFLNVYLWSGNHTIFLRLLETTGLWEGKWV